MTKLFLVLVLTGVLNFSSSLEFSILVLLIWKLLFLPTGHKIGEIILFLFL